jgi:hypothetical protein
VNDQVSHQYKRTGKIIVPYFLILLFLESEPEDEGSAPNDSKHSLTSYFLNFALNRIVIRQGFPQM